MIFSRNSPRCSRDLGTSGAASSGFSGFDSDSGDTSVPLPRPTTSGLGIDHGVGNGSGSVSVSSVSSSGSSDDHPSAQEHLQFGGLRWVSSFQFRTFLTPIVAYLCCSDIGVL